MKNILFSVALIISLITTGSLVHAAGDDEPIPTTICDFLVRIDKRLDKIEKRIENLEQNATPQLSEVIGSFGEKKPTYFSPDDVLQDDNGQPVEKIRVTMMSTVDTNMTTGFREPFTQYKKGKTYEVLPNIAVFWTERGLAKKEYSSEVPPEITATRTSDTDSEIYMQIFTTEKCSIPQRSLKGWTGEGRTNLSKNHNYFVEYSQAQELIRQRLAKEV